MKNKKFDHLAFPAIMVISEWALQTFTPFATWGAVSYTQINNLPILQITSLFGIAGLGFIIYLVNILLEKLFLSKSVSKRTFLIAGATISILLSYGYLRLTILEHQPKSTVLVAAVGTNNDVSGLPFLRKM